MNKCINVASENLKSVFITGRGDDRPGIDGNWRLRDNYHSSDDRSNSHMAEYHEKYDDRNDTNENRKKSYTSGTYEDRPGASENLRNSYSNNDRRSSFHRTEHSGKPEDKPGTNENPQANYISWDRSKPHSVDCSGRNDDKPENEKNTNTVKEKPELTMTAKETPRNKIPTHTSIKQDETNKEHTTTASNGGGSTVTETNQNINDTPSPSFLGVEGRKTEKQKQPPDLPSQL